VFRVRCSMLVWRKEGHLACKQYGFFDEHSDLTSAWFVQICRYIMSVLTVIIVILHELITIMSISVYLKSMSHDIPPDPTLQYVMQTRSSVFALCYELHWQLVFVGEISGKWNQPSCVCLFHWKTFLICLQSSKDLIHTHLAIEFIKFFTVKCFYGYLQLSTLISFLISLVHMHRQHTRLYVDEFRFL